MRLADIYARTVATTVEIFGEEVALEVRPAVFTSEFEQQVSSATTSLELAGLLARLVASIDITEPDADGVEQPIRCDGATFDRVIPIAILKDLWQTIGETIRPGEAPGGTSANG